MKLFVLKLSNALEVSRSLTIQTRLRDNTPRITRSTALSHLSNPLACLLAGRTLVSSHAMAGGMPVAEVKATSTCNTTTGAAPFGPRMPAAFLVPQTGAPTPPRGIRVPNATCTPTPSPEIQLSGRPNSYRTVVVVVRV